MNATHNLERTIEDMLSGIKIINDSEAANRERARDTRDRFFKAQTLIANSHIPPRHLSTVPLEDGVWGEKFTKLKALVGTGTLSLLIGIRGCGKTQLAVGLLKHAAHLGCSPLYCTAARIGIELRSAFTKDGTGVTEKSVLKKYTLPRVLVIDEFGKSNESGYQDVVMFELLNQRYNEMKDTFLLSNHTSTELVEQLGASIVSRVQECGLVVELTNPSFRVGGAK